MPYFKQNEVSGHYEKSIVVDGSKWLLKVYPEMWSPKTSKAVSRWINNVRNGGDALFRWGEIEKEDSQEIIHCENVCSICGRIYSTRSGLWKHEQLCTKNVRETIAPGHNTTVEAGGTQINQSIHNTININIRDFGKENPEWLTEGFLYAVIGDVDRAIPMMMKRKHFNDKFPENMNLKLNTRGDINKRLQIRENGKWRLRDSKQTFYKVLIDIYDILCDALTEEAELHNELHPEVEKARRSQRFLEKVKKIRPLWEEFRKKMREEDSPEGDDPEVVKNLWEDLKTMLLDRKLCAEQEV